MSPKTDKQPTKRGRWRAAGRQGKVRRPRGERIRQVGQAFTLTRRNDPRMVPLVAGSALVTLAVFVALGFVFDQVFYLTVIGVALAALAGTVVFGRRASASAFRNVEGQPGAGAAVLQSMRGNWRVTPAVAFNRNQDLVHRVIGRPGVILVGEGTPGRLGGLLAQERKRVTRVVGETPVYDVQMGDADGQVPLRKLQRHVTKLPRNIKPAQVNEVDRRLTALGGANVPLPKGPLPKGAKRPPKGTMR